jgi:hypothetical protein
MGVSLADGAETSSGMGDHCGVANILSLNHFMLQRYSCRRTFTKKIKIMIGSVMPYKAKVYYALVPR